MGLRFRKSIKLPLGFRINFSKSGVGYSWGTKGYRKTVTANGKIRTTYSIPKTGISYVEEENLGRSRTTKQQIIEEEHTPTQITDNPKKRLSNRVSLTLISIFLLLIILAVFLPAKKETVTNEYSQNKPVTTSNVTPVKSEASDIMRHKEAEQNILINQTIPQKKSIDIETSDPVVPPGIKIKELSETEIEELKTIITSMIQIDEQDSLKTLKTFQDKLNAKE